MKNIVFRSKKFFSPFRPILNNFNHQIAKKNLKSFPQMAIFSFDHIGLLINLDGRYEHDALELIKDYILTSGCIDPTSCALDIGANIGNHALLFAEYFKHVFAFEPNPQAYRLLKFYAFSRNISTFNYGLSDENCTTSFQVSAANIGGSKILENNVDVSDDKVMDVDVRRLDDLIELADVNISLIKIDVEGHELSVLKGAKGIIEKDEPIILFEQEIDEISDGSSAVIDFVRSHGHRLLAIENRFYIGEKFSLRLLSLLLKTAFGYQKILVDKAYFEKKHYEMIVAIKHHKHNL